MLLLWRKHCSFFLFIFVKHFFPVTATSYCYNGTDYFRCEFYQRCCVNNTSCCVKVGTVAWCVGGMTALLVVLTVWCRRQHQAALQGQLKRAQPAIQRHERCCPLRAKDPSIDAECCCRRRREAQAWLAARRPTAVLP